MAGSHSERKRAAKTPQEVDVRPANPLATWLDLRRVTNAELAKRIDVSAETVSRIRRGVNRPDDDMKIKIAVATKAIETELGLAQPRGVFCSDWFRAAA